MTVGYLLLSVAAAMAYFILPTTPLSKLLLYNGIGLAAVIATLVGIRHKSPETRSAWKLIVAGLISFLAGDVRWSSADF